MTDEARSQYGAAAGETPEATLGPVLPISSQRLLEKNAAEKKSGRKGDIRRHGLHVCQFLKQLELANHGYTNAALRTAWQESRNEDIAIPTRPRP